MAGAGGIGGGAIAGSAGIEGVGKPGDAGEFGEAGFDEPAGPAGLAEIICVYAPGLLGGADWLGAGSAAGRLNAFVAPSGAKAAGGFSIFGFGNVGFGKIGGAGTETTGRAGATYDAGCGGWSGWEGAIGPFGAGKTDKSSATDRSNALGGATGVPDVRDTIFGLLNHPVNPEPAGSFPATPCAGGGASASGRLNIAVKSPTDLRGGSAVCGDATGVSEGPSTRNGP